MSKIQSQLILLLALLNYIAARLMFNTSTTNCYSSRKGTSGILNCPRLVDDPQFFNQWMLVSRPYPELGGRTSIDLGILDVWFEYGFMGKGVTVVINDNGIETDHPEFRNRINMGLSYDFCNDVSNPKHKNDDEEHGTMIAGIVGMEINNGFCGVGIAPEVTFGVRRVVNSRMICANHTEGRAFTRQQERIDITINSYGSNFMLKIPYDLLKALKQSVEKGRRGLGTVHVFAGGNDKESGKTCTYDKYLANIYVIVVAAITPWGEASYYSARCANLMVTAPATCKEDCFTITASSRRSCSRKFCGTSAAAPVVGAVLALTFDANDRLTWRDAQHLLALTSETDRVHVNSKSFQINGAGIPVSYDYGFGVINALNMVDSALFFETVPPLKICELPITLDESVLREFYVVTVVSDGCIDSPSHTVMYLEHVQLEIEVSHPSWYNVHIDLTSPAGTIAKMLEKENYRIFATPFKWIFDSVATWGECPLGTWQIIMHDNHSSNTTFGVIHSLKIIMYGTSIKPAHLNVNY